MNANMFRRFAVLFATISCLCSCDVDYDLGSRDAEPRVVVNALLTPQEDFIVRLFWSGTYSGGDMEFRPVDNADIRLLENGAEVLRRAASPDGETATTFRATAGRSYRLEIDVPRYGKLSAMTSVPEVPTVEIRKTKDQGSYSHFEMTELRMESEAKAIWIKGIYREPDTGWGAKEEKISEYHTTSPFVDQVNGANDTQDAEDKGATVDFEGFLRIAQENCEAALPLRFSVWGSSTAWTQCRHTFRIIAASDAYDRYMRSRYKQEKNSEAEAEGNPFIEQITVYSDIENGMGIFAGYNYYRTSEL